MVDFVGIVLYVIIRVLIIFFYFNLDFIEKLIQVEIILVDYKIKNVYWRKVNLCINLGLRIDFLIYNLIIFQGIKRKLNQFGIICFY